MLTQLTHNASKMESQLAPGNVWVATEVDTTGCAISLACAFLSAKLIGFASKMHYVLTALTKYWSYADSNAKSVALISTQLIKEH